MKSVVCVINLKKKEDNVCILYHSVNVFVLDAKKEQTCVKYVFYWLFELNKLYSPLHVIQKQFSYILSISNS